MIGEISFGGVYFPALLVLALMALGITTALITLFTIVGAYRLIAARPLVDLSLYIVCLWALVEVSVNWKLPP
jgi:hypothetical protein